MPRARGSASRINKRTSHITMTLGEVKKILLRLRKQNNMSKTVHPYAHRLVVLRDWKSRWFADKKIYKDLLKVTQSCVII